MNSDVSSINIYSSAVLATGIATSSLYSPNNVRSLADSIIMTTMGILGAALSSENQSRLPGTVGLSVGATLFFANLYELTPDILVDIQTSFREYNAPLAQGLASFLLSESLQLIVPGAGSTVLKITFPMLINQYIDFLTSTDKETDAPSLNSRTVTYFSPYVFDFCFNQV